MSVPEPPVETWRELWAYIRADRARQARALVLAGCLFLFAAELLILTLVVAGLAVAGSV